MTARDALRSWLAFLDACTESAPISGWFGFPETPGLPVPPHVRQQIELAFPGGSGVVPWARADEAIGLFESLEPLPVNPWGMAPVWLSFTAEFRLLQPGTTEPWPGQDTGLFGEFATPGGVKLGASYTDLTLQARKSIGLSMSIPHATDGDLAMIVPWLQAALPLRLSPKHWSRWTLTKSGHSYRGQRIALSA